MRVTALLLVLLLGGCYGVPARLDSLGPAKTPEQATADWAAILDQHVDDQGRVDFRGLATARARLDRFVAYVYAVSPDSHPDLFPTRDHELAYLINAYNALAMVNVLEQDFPRTLAATNLVDFFILPHFELGGQPINLFDLERALIIPRYTEPRAHFALNCMVQDCPRLPQQPFTGDSLQAELDAATREFVTKPENVIVDHAAQTVTLNEIFGFYEEEYLAVASGLLAYVNRYRPQDPVPEDYAVAFRPYNWRLNAQPDEGAI